MSWQPDVHVLDIFQGLTGAGGSRALSGGADDVFISGCTTAVGIRDGVFFSGNIKMSAEVHTDGEDTTAILI